MTTAHPTAALSDAAARLRDYLARGGSGSQPDNRLAAGVLRVAVRCAELAARGDGCAFDIAATLGMTLVTNGRMLAGCTDAGCTDARLRSELVAAAALLRTSEANTGPEASRALSLGDPLRLALSLAAYLDAVALALAGNPAAVLTAQRHLHRDALAASRAWQPEACAASDLAAALRESRQDRRRPGAS